jgi:hypothetical protein
LLLPLLPLAALLRATGLLQPLLSFSSAKPAAATGGCSATLLWLTVLQQLTRWLLLPQCCWRIAAIPACNGDVELAQLVLNDISGDANSGVHGVFGDPGCCSPMPDPRSKSSPAAPLRGDDAALMLMLWLSDTRSSSAQHAAAADLLVGDADLLRCCSRSTAAATAALACCCI